MSILRIEKRTRASSVAIMKLDGTTALVTGANRGLGRHFAQQLLERGARKVYATARDPSTIDLRGVTTLALDVTDPRAFAAAATAAPDVDLLVNNAGISTGTGLVAGDLDILRREFETNYWGVLEAIRAFQPILAANGGGAVLNVLSQLSWMSFAGSTGYAASKAAAWSLTNGIRLELAEQRTLVTALMLSATDTDMTAAWDAPKNDPADVVRQALDGLAAGRWEVVADSDTAATKANLVLEPEKVYR
jgi:NAD(P)-dependent dehydrogenase (short-subunit alcohol dehydrogenase family)